MTTINLPLNAFLGILFGEFGDPSYPSKVTTPLLGERYVVKLLPYAIGKLFKELDANEELFHIELVEPEKQAEVWLVPDWKQSLTRRDKLRSVLDAEKSELNVTKEIFVQIFPIILQKSNGQEDWARQMAQSIIRMRRNFEIPDVLEALDIKAIMDQYKE